MPRNLPPAAPIGTTVSRRSQAASSAVAVPVSTSSFQQPASQSRGYLLRDDGQWSWQDLRDYVVGQIEQRFGPFPRDAVKEASIFKGFVSRHGASAAPIARYAFEVCGGVWANGNIQVYRFCKGSDPFFAVPIAQRLSEAS